MKELKEKTAVSTAKLVGLSLASGGLYLLCHLLQNQKEYKKQLGDSVLPEGLMLATIITWGLSAYAKTIACTTFNQKWIKQSDVNTAINWVSLSGLLNLAAGISLIILAFKMKAALEEKMQRPLNGFLTFFFNIFYINHVIDNFDKVPATVKAAVNTDDLEKYAELLQKGILSQDEFDAKKKEILGL